MPNDGITQDRLKTCLLKDVNTPVCTPLCLPAISILYASRISREGCRQGVEALRNNSTFDPWKCRWLCLHGDQVILKSAEAILYRLKTRVSLVTLTTQNMEEKKIEFGNGLHGIICGAGSRSTVVISHGAGRGMDAPVLVKTATQLAALGFIVLRYNFGYLGKRPAPSRNGVNEQKEVISAIEYMQQFGKQPILIGKSFGARVGSYVAAERSDIRGLVYYGMPLVGMSKSAKQRDWSHLCKIKVPMLFITGDKDTLCPLDHLSEVQKYITVPFKSEIVAGDHSFKPKSEDQAVKLCIDWLDKTFRDP